MISLRLTKELEDKLESIAKKERMTKSALIREALEEYLINKENSGNPYELGEDLFGKYGSGDGKLSVEYKKRVKDKIHEKMSY